jgi:hypothetical protein
LKRFVDQHRNMFGVEPICKVLQIVLSCYRRHAALQRNPPPTDRSLNKRDAAGKVIDGFHLDYISTYEPGFRSGVRHDSAKISNGKLHASKSKAVRESTKSLAMPIESFPKTKSKAIA